MTLQKHHRYDNTINVNLIEWKISIRETLDYENGIKKNAQNC